MLALARGCFASLLLLCLVLLVLRLLFLSFAAHLGRSSPGVVTRKVSRKDGDNHEEEEEEEE